VDRDVFAQVVAGDLHHAVVGGAPRPGGRPVAAGDHHAPRSRQDVLGAVALRNLLAERLDGRDADHARAGLETHRLQLLFTRHDGLRIIPSGIIRPA